MKELFENMCATDDRYCGVLAVVKLSGKDYDSIYHAFTKVGRKHGQGVYDTQIMRVLEALGMRIEYAWRFWKPFAGTNTKEREFILPSNPYTTEIFWVKRAMTVRNLEKWKGLDKKRKYLGLTRNHAFAVCNGIVDDWSRTSRRVVEELYEVK